MIAFKDGVSSEGLSGDIWRAAFLCEPIFARYHVDLVVTSGRGGKHSVRRSQHYAGRAMDWRSRHLKQEHRTKVLKYIKEMLGVDYVCILESPDKPYQHFHIHHGPVYSPSLDPDLRAI